MLGICSFAPIKAQIMIKSFSQLLRVPVICAAAFVAATTANAQQPMLQNGNSFEQSILSQHNQARTALGLGALRWDAALAAAANAYAASMAKTGKYEHSHHATQGENMWMGTQNYFSLNEMVGSWIIEQSLAKSGKFPNVTKTASWADVGHYTQIIWKDTLSVGCGIADGGGYSYFVCRYFPAGNVIGTYLKVE
jgi:uncharacterized protein YkwD